MKNYQASHRCFLSNDQLLKANLYWLVACFSFKLWSPVVLLKTSRQEEISGYSELCSAVVCFSVIMWVGIPKTKHEKVSVWTRNRDSAEPQRHSRSAFRMQRTVCLVFLMVLGLALTLEAAPTLTQENFDLEKVSFQENSVDMEFFFFPLWNL